MSDGMSEVERGTYWSDRGRPVRIKKAAILEAIDDAVDSELTGMREAHAALERRVAALDLVLRRLLSENAHILVGGVAFSEQSLDELDRAQDHGGTEAGQAASATRNTPTAPAGAASVQPAPAPCPDCGKRLCQCKQPAPAPEPSEARALLARWRETASHYDRVGATHPAAIQMCCVRDLEAALPRLEREAGERMVRRFAASIIATWPWLNADFKAGLNDLAERFLKEGA